MSKKFLYTKVSQNIITWASTLADLASLHLFIDFVLFLLEVGKNPLMIVNKVCHSPFPYQIFTKEVKAAIQVCCMQGHRLSAKKEQKHMYQSTFFSLSQ
jgi:hypothetical protein